MKGNYSLLLLVIVGVGVYLLVQSFANAETEISNVVSAPFNVFGSLVGGVTSELGALWNYITGQDTTDDVTFNSDGYGVGSSY